MQTLKEILFQAATSPEAIGMAANAVVVVAGLVSTWMAARWVRGNARRAKVLAIFFRAAREVFDEVVRALKQKTEDGTLTPAEQREVLQAGIQRAKEIGRTEGIDIVKEVGHEMLPVFMEWAVGRLKARGLPDDLGGLRGALYSMSR